MREEFKRLRKWVEMCPVEAAMRIDELEAKNESMKQALEQVAYKTFPVEPKRIVAKMQTIARTALETKE